MWQISRPPTNILYLLEENKTTLEIIKEPLFRRAFGRGVGCVEPVTRADENLHTGKFQGNWDDSSEMSRNTTAGSNFESKELAP